MNTDILSSQHFFVNERACPLNYISSVLPTSNCVMMMCMYVCQTSEVLLSGKKYAFDTGKYSCMNVVAITVTDIITLMTSTLLMTFSSFIM